MSDYLAIIFSVIGCVLLLLFWIDENIPRYSCPESVIEKCSNAVHPNSCRQMYIYENICMEYTKKEEENK